VLIIAASTSSSTLGSCGASNSFIFKFLGFVLISTIVFNLTSLNVNRPCFTKISKALLSFVGSFGTAIVAPSYKSLKDFIFLEYKPIGSKCTFTVFINSVFLFALNSTKYGKC